MERRGTGNRMEEKRWGNEGVSREEARGGERILRIYLNRVQSNGCFLVKKDESPQRGC